MFYADFKQELPCKCLLVWSFLSVNYLVQVQKVKLKFELMLFLHTKYIHFRPGSLCTEGVNTFILQADAVIFKVVLLPEHPRRVIVIHVRVYLFWCKVWWLLKVGLKLSFFLFFFLVKLSQLKGKYRLCAALRSGSARRAGRIYTGSTGTLFPFQHLLQSSSNHSFAVF